MDTRIEEVIKYRKVFTFIINLKLDPTVAQKTRAKQLNVLN